MPEPDRDVFNKAIARAVAALSGDDRLTLVEVAADGITAFRIRRDENGTPRAHSWSSTWTELGIADGPAPHADQAVLRAAHLDSPVTGEVILACSSPESSGAGHALDWLRAAAPAAPMFRVDMPVAALVKECLARDPLTRSYDLIVMRANRNTGRLELTGKMLFPVGSPPGVSTAVTVRCEPSDDRGTAFAVVTWKGLEPQLLSLHSARLAPRRYELTARLVRPGLVRFTGLPGLIPDPRNWSELLESMPAQLPPKTGPVHLICAVEVCGAADKVTERLSRADQVITSLAIELEDLLRVSFIAYGAHSFDRKAKEVPVEVAAWQKGVGEALAAVRRAVDRGPITMGYPYHPHAAQLEDVLAEVARRLDRTGDGAATALLTVGDRPPYPARPHRSGILPCPNRHDWERMMGHLERRTGLAFGAICDRAPDQAHPVWRRLGAGALAHLDSPDFENLAPDLGLAAPATGRIPFPLLDETE